MQPFNSEVEAADKLAETYKKLKEEIGKKIIGQDEVIKFLMIGIFSQGHCLLVGVPGLAKTLLIKTIADVLDLSFSRIQFTPDLMPSDIIGSETLDKERNFKFIKGPVFANIILADEINRTPPKTQSALLESMQEYAVTVGGVKYDLNPPFFVLATQNPIEQEGTYPLPEAQLDRFMFNIKLDYPRYDQEVEIIKATTGEIKTTLEKIITGEDILSFQQLIRKVPVNDHVISFAVKLAQSTRPGNEGVAPVADQFLEWGGGPRASQYLVIAAKCHALLNGKYSPDIEDVEAIAVPTLRHRILRNFKAEADEITEEYIISELIKFVKS